MLSRTLAALLPLVPKPLVSGVARRYVAGETLEDALLASADLNRQGSRVTIALLGEHSASADESENAVGEYTKLLERIEADGLDANISVKPTHVGLDLDRQLCFENLRQLVETAAERQNFVRIDMEDRHATAPTLSIYERLRSSYHNVGVVLQACLRRTLDDIDLLHRDRTNVRICKGIYVEPRAVAYRDFDRIRQNFIAAVERLCAGGAYVGIATHDSYLVEHCEKLLERRGLTADNYEFQMLLGVQPRLRQALQERQHPMRVYVPYGPDWYDYSLRRLRENPRIAGHVLRALFTRR